jgi:hypothetical protein
VTRALLLAAALLAAGCHEGNTLDNAGPFSGTTVDLAQGPNQSVDLAQVTATFDMTAEATCGSIVTCAVTCLGSAGTGGGIGGLAGCTSCLQGAPPDATAEAQAIVTCAITNCISAITGGGGTAGIFQCLATSCTAELAACQGLGLGGI